MPAACAWFFEIPFVWIYECVCLPVCVFTSGLKPSGLPGQSVHILCVCLLGQTRTIKIYIYIYIYIYNAWLWQY